MSGAALDVGALVASLDERFPFAWAELWDRVGLAVGDPAAEVTNVFVTLDPTAAAMDAAAVAGANVLVTHHPAFLEPLASMTPSLAGVAFSAASRGMALVACHTNLDRAPAGSAALPLALGLEPGEPLERTRQPMALVTSFVPEAAAAAVVAAMSRAGAGRIGEYRDAAFTARGMGSFVPLGGSRPYTGTVGQSSSAEEMRLEMVCAPADVPAVVSAARSAHPYEEPLIVVGDVAIDRGAARLGRLCALPERSSLADFAAHVAAGLSVTPRVWGDPGAPVTLVAVASGSGKSLVGAAVAAGASVLLTGEVGYHVALDALAAGLAVVEAGHDATEWPLVEVLAEALRSHPALADRVIVDVPVMRWWTT